MVEFQKPLTSCVYFALLRLNYCSEKEFSSTYFVSYFTSKRATQNPLYRLATEGCSHVQKSSNFSYA